MDAFKLLRKKFEQSKHGDSSKDKSKAKAGASGEDKSKDKSKAKSQTEDKSKIKTQNDLKPTVKEPEKTSGKSSIDVKLHKPEPHVAQKSTVQNASLKPPVAKKPIWRTEEKGAPESSAADRKSSLSDEKLQELQDAFILFDKNQDGRITKEELGAMLYALGQRPTVHEVQALIRSVDLDQSGTIEYDEFVKIFTAKLSIDPEKELEEVFGIFDQNGDGFISSEELYEMLHKLGEHITQAEAKKMINEADLNRDGKVDYREFKAILNAR